MKIALVLASSTGGVGAHVRSLAAHLAGSGHRVRVCGPRAAEELFGFGAVGAVFTPVEIPANPHPLRDAGAIAALRGATAGADVVHAHGLRAGLVAALVRRRPLVVTWHNVLLATGVKGRVLGRLERIVARSADITLTASEDLTTRALSLGATDVRFAPVGAPPLPVGTADGVRAELKAGDRPVILSVGRLHPQKSFGTLVDAAARWATLDPAPVVAVAGSGPDEAALKARAGEHVTFLGHRGDVADLLAAADLAVVTSQWEARQLFAQEALHAGVPLVATNVGGLPGLVGDGAVLIPPGDVDALEGAVRRLLADPSAAAALAARGREVAAGWPSEADTAAAAEAVYAELTG